MSVFVVGALHLDVIVTAPHLPRRDETVVGQGVAYRLGGKGGNQAVAVAKMGAASAMAGCIGDDTFGQRLLDELAEGRVDHQQVIQRPGASGMSVAIVEAGGDYGAVIVSGVNQQIDPAIITIPDTASTLLLQNEIPEAVNIALATRASVTGCRVILNAAPARRPEPGLLAQTDLLILNRVEAADLVGPSNATPETAIRQLAEFGPAVLLTLGADGLIWHDNGETQAIPAYRVEPISTHGAGDAFIGALAAELDRGATLQAAARFAQAAAALHVASPVAERVGITRKAVAHFLSGQTASR